jgi:hypothetical protein
MYWEVAVAARDGSAAPQGSSDDDGLLWWTSYSKRMMGSFTVGPSTSSQPSIAASGGGRWRAMEAARVLGLSLLRNKFNQFRPLYIGVLVLKHRRQRS